MIKELTIYVVASALSLACLGLITLAMARDTIKDIHARSPDQ